MGKYCVDMSECHTYRLENRVSEEANMVWLYVDGAEIGPMNVCNPRTAESAAVSDWVSGKDFLFSNIGMQGVELHACSVDYIQVWEEGLSHAVPSSVGVSNAIKRAYQLTDVTWTPIKNLPGVVNEDGKYNYKEFQKGTIYKGIPYSGVINTDTYVGLNVSLDSFMTALQNENSVLYTKNLYKASHPKCATYFGTVCSKFAQYALNIPGSYNTSNIPNIEGLDTIAQSGNYTVDDLKLGDIIVDTSYHTALCTDILYSPNGDVAYIEISEAVTPRVRRIQWRAKDFFEQFPKYRLCRYQYIDSVPYKQNMYVNVGNETGAVEQFDCALMPRYGDKYNYTVHESEMGVVDILKDGYQKAIILKDGVSVSEIPLDDSVKTVEFSRKVPGYFEIYLETAEGEKSESVYACVVTSSVDVVDTSEFFAGKLSVHCEGTSGTPIYVQLGSVSDSVFCRLDDTENETAVVQFRASAVNTGQVRVAYQNEYGIYLSAWKKFTIDDSKGTGANPSHDPLLSQGVYWDGYVMSTTSAKPIVQENKPGYWMYAKVPVEGGATYFSEGATRTWFLDSKGKQISTINIYTQCTPPFRFTVPEDAAYVNLSYSPALVEKGAETLILVDETEPSGNPSSDPILSQGEYRNGRTLTPENSEPIVKEGKGDYWTYVNIPVKGGATYYSQGANRTWFFDEAGAPICTVNVYSDFETAFQFTTPDNAAFASITYSPFLVTKGTETMIEVIEEETAKYRINKITVLNADGVEMDQIPADRCLITISVTNQTADGDGYVFLAAYSGESQYIGLTWIGVEDLSVDATLKVTLPLDNESGTIENIKAFVVASFEDLTPLGETVSFLP